MKALSTANSAGRSDHEMRAVRFPHVGGMVIVSLFLGLTAAIVAFGAAAAFENSKWELIAPCVTAALYLAFCQFWVAPRGSSGFWSKLPTLAGSVVPLLLDIDLPPRIWGIPWVMVSGGVGSVIGAMVAQWVTTPRRRDTLTGSFNNRGRSCRKNLLTGFVLLSAVALLIAIGVIPSVLADNSSDFKPGPAGLFLGVTVVFVLMVEGLLASAVWRNRDHEHSSKGTLGITAFLALFLALIYGVVGIAVGRHGPDMRTASIVLILCAVLGLITTALMSVTSVIVDRARWSDLHGFK